MKKNCYFSGFAKFVENDDSKFVDLAKRNFGVTTKAFEGMPVQIPAGTKINGKTLGMPLILYVRNADDAGVTLSNVPTNIVPFSGNKPDADGEFNANPGVPQKEISLRVSTKEFQKMLKPPALPAQQSPGGIQ